MFGSKNRARIQELENEATVMKAVIAQRDASLNSLRGEKALVGRLLREALDERDAARAQLQPFLDRQEKAKQNLRQFQRQPSTAERPF